MRTNVHWAMKSQQPCAVSWAITTRNNNGCESITRGGLGTGSVMRRSCITDKKIDILTERIGTYSNYIV